MSIVELSSLSGKNVFSNFMLSKIIEPDSKYILNKQTVNNLKLHNEHNCILSLPGRDYFGRKRLRLSFNIDNTEELDLSRNYISSIPNKILPRALKRLNISHNIINKFDNIIDHIPNLEYFNCSHNYFTNLPPLTNNLKVFIADNCRLNSIPHVPNVLEKLIINNNNLTELPDGILNCNQMIELNYEGNPNITVSEEILAFIETIFERQRAIREQQQNNNLIAPYGNYVKETDIIYGDSQNVHDSKIRKEISKAIEILMKDEMKFTDKEALKEFKKYANKDDYIFIKSLINMIYIDSMTKCSFGTIFKLFLNRVYMSKDKEEILNIFIKEAIPDMKIVCFVGRISRVINSLSGFFPDIEIKITEGQQIQAKHNIVIKKFEGIKLFPMKYNIMCYYTFKELLEEIEIEKNTIDKWLYHYIEELEEIFEENEPDYENLKLPIDIMNKFKEDYNNDIFIT